MNDKARQNFEDAGADLSEALTIDDLSVGDKVIKNAVDFETVTVEGFEEFGYAVRAVLSDGEKVTEAAMWDPEEGGIPHLAPVEEKQ